MIEKCQILLEKLIVKEDVYFLSIYWADSVCTRDRKKGQTQALPLRSFPSIRGDETNIQVTKM